jgi:hypothetical protein
LSAEKHVRLGEILQRLRKAAPFGKAFDARLALEEIINDVEDEMSGIPADPNAATAVVADGRIYPPHDRFQISSGNADIVTFRQKGHRTSFGKNGSILIVSAVGATVLDLPGVDQRTVTDLMHKPEKTGVENE